MTNRSKCYSESALNEPNESLWLRMFKQPLVSTEIIDSKPCLDLLEQKRQANVAELFGNETFKNAMTSQGLNVDGLAKLEPSEINNLTEGMLLGEKSTFRKLVYQIIVLDIVRNAVQIGRLDENAFKSVLIIDAFAELNFNIPILVSKLPYFVTSTKGYYTPTARDRDISIDGSLREYLYIGDLFKQQPTKRHDELIAMMEDLYRVPSIDELKLGKSNAEFPYVVITAPSGTGKTQLPFSIAKYPVLYFTTIEEANSTSSQEIYQNFKNLSKHLHEAVICDMKKFQSQPRIVFSMKTVKHLHGANIRYRTLGFLISLLKTILAEARSRSPITATRRDQRVIMPTNWLLAQIECPQFEYEELTMYEARKQLKEMFKTDHPVVLIFIDEVNKMLEPSLRLLRSLIRSIELVFFIMGTNLNSEDFEREFNFSGSRICGLPWCYLVHRLPPACPAFIEQKRNQVASLKPPQQLRKFVKLLFKLMAAFFIMGTNLNSEDFEREFNFSGSRICGLPWCYLVHRLPPACPAFIEQKRNQVASLKPPQQLRKFVKLLFKLMAAERPLFVVKACNEMIDAFSNNPVSTDTELLERIVGKIFTEFVQVNGVEIDDDFYKGQVDFLDPRPRQARSASFINKHVAYFDARVVEIQGVRRHGYVNPFDIKVVHQDNGNTFFKVEYKDVTFSKRSGSEPTRKICIIKDQNRSAWFDIKSVMPEFDKEPITGLCFTGAFPVLDQFFLTKEKKPASCLKKYSELFSPLPLHNHDSRASLDGMYLEKVAAMSLILASHAVSIGDVLNFDEFFKKFIRQLQDNYDHKPNIKCEKDDMKLWEQFSKIRIPYCGSISAKWNKELFDHLTKSKCLLGTVQETKADEGVDVVMYRGNNESEPLISVECRLNIANSDISEIGTKWDTLTQREVEPNNPRKRTIEDKIKDLGQALEKEPSIPPINILLVRKLTDATNFETMAKSLEDQRIWLVKLIKADGGCNSDYLLQSQYKANKIKRIYIMMDLNTIAPNTNKLINLKCRNLAK